MRSLFRNRLRFSLGSDLKASFRVDLWIEGRCRLRDRFLSLFNLSVQKKESMGSTWDGESEP